MVSAIGILALLPWLDRSYVRSCIFRPWHRRFLLLFVVNFFLLMYIGAMPAEGIYVTIGQIATLYWFAHFLVILPLVSHFETPLPMPATINEYMEWKAQGRIKAMPWMK